MTYATIIQRRRWKEHAVALDTEFRLKRNKSLVHWIQNSMHAAAAIVISLIETNGPDTEDLRLALAQLQIARFQIFIKSGIETDSDMKLSGVLQHWMHIFGER